MSNKLSADLNSILASTVPLWEELRGQELFITGGTGFFGCWLLESFVWANRTLNLNAKATVLTRNPEVFQAKASHLASAPCVNLCKGDVMGFSFPKGEYPFIIHAATEASAKLNSENPLLMLDTIVTGTRRVLDFAAQAGTKKFLLTSSGAVYGKQPSDLDQIPEDYLGAPDTMNPHWAYGEGKRLAELLCAMYSKIHGFETKIARCFAFVGPYLPLDAHFAIGNFIRDAMAGGPINVNGDGTPYRSYMYATDLVVWLWTILLKGKNCHPYNVGSDQSVTIEQLATTVAACIGKKLDTRIAQKKTPGKKAERYVPAVERVKSAFGLNALVGLESAIKKTISYHNS